MNPRELSRRKRKREIQKIASGKMWSSEVKWCSLTRRLYEQEPKMKFAINYSKSSTELLEAGVIAVDLFKCPEWPELLEEVGRKHPMYFHFCLMAGRSNLRTADLNFVFEMMQKTGTRNLNIHLAPEYRNFENLSVESILPGDADRLSEAMLEDIAWIRPRFDVERTVLENCPWSTRPDYPIPAASFLPQVVARVVHESGCGFLLDIAHALLAAKWLKMDVYDYLKQMPVETLREIHISGTREIRPGAWTDHYPLREEDWTATGWVFDRIAAGEWPCPQMVTFEYGGVGPKFEARTDADVIARQTPILYEMVQHAGSKG
jgi:uncharacterized protein